MLRTFLAAIIAIVSLGGVTWAAERASVPGALNPAVTQDTIRKTICKAGWTKTVRPPVSYTNKLKKAQIAAFEDRVPAHWEEDHAMPIELGGAPRDPLNLWAQPIKEARVKDVDETSLHRAVCKGTMTLELAREKIREKWLAP